MLQRRDFLKTSLFLSMAPLGLSTAAGKPTVAHKIIKPAPLKQGARIGMIAPASPTWEKDQTRMAIEIVESLGFKVKPGKFLFHRKGYLAGEDKDRARDLNEMFADDDIDGIIALRGGYGTPRILPFLDYDLIRANPKLIMGYSDITALLNAIHSKTGLITFHGPVSTANLKPYTLQALKNVIFGGSAPLSLGAPPPFEGGEGVIDKENRLLRLVPGKARGRLIGGNLTLMCRLMGTPYQPDFNGKILFLEDVNEAPYRIDSMLTHLWLTGALKQLSGLVFGKFTDCYPTDKANNLDLETIFSERCRQLGIPAIRGLMIGHISQQATVPIGAMAELDVDAGSLKLVEPWMA